MNVLDKGYLELVTSWGNDEAVIEAARMSTGKGFLGWEAGSCPACSGSGTVLSTSTVWDEEPLRVFVDGYITLQGGSSRTVTHSTTCGVCGGSGTHRGDAALLKYLAAHRHTTPFEMAGAAFEVKAPIIVFREWHRHRTQSYNEMSARYTPLPNESYMPTVGRCLQTGKSRQSQGTGAQLNQEAAELWLLKLDDLYRQCEETYQHGLAVGIPKELARLATTVGRYSRMRASANLWNWARFLVLRLGEDAQDEIRQFAKAVAHELSILFPRSAALLVGGSP